MKKNRETILFIEWCMSYGGIEKSLVSLANGLIDSYDVEVLILNKQNADISSQFDFRVKIKYLSPASTFKIAYQAFKLMPRLTRLLIGLKRKYDYEIVYNFSMEGNLAKFINGRTNITFIHGDFYPDTPFARYMAGEFDKKPSWKCRITALIDKADKLACVSENAKEGFIEFFGTKYVDKIEIFPNCLDTDNITKKSLEPIEPLSDAALKLVSVSRLATGKNVIDLIKMQEILLKKGLDSSLTIVGNGPELAKLQEYSANNGIAKVYFVGNQLNPYKYVKAADIFVFASIEESMGLVIAEAMLLGLPVVSYANRGVVSCYGDYIAITPFSPEALADAVIDEWNNKRQDTAKSREFALSLDYTRAPEYFNKLCAKAYHGENGDE